MFPPGLEIKEKVRGLWWLWKRLGICDDSGKGQGNEVARNGMFWQFQHTGTHVFCWKFLHSSLTFYSIRDSFLHRCGQFLHCWNFIIFHCSFTVLFSHDPYNISLPFHADSPSWNGPSEHLRIMSMMLSLLIWTLALLSEDEVLGK